MPRSAPKSPAIIRISDFSPKGTECKTLRLHLCSLAGSMECTVLLTPLLGGQGLPAWPGLPSGCRGPELGELGQPEERKVKSNTMGGIWSDLSVSAPDLLGKGLWHSRGEVCSPLSCPCPRPLLLTKEGTSCLLPCHLARRPLFPLSQASPGLVPSRSTSTDSEGLCTTTQNQRARETSVNNGTLSVCLLPKHLTGIKVSPRGNNSTY
jgi:hypothetical protein